MKKIVLLFILMIMINLIHSEEKAMSIYDFTMEDISGNEVKLEGYKGKVILMVNTASKCGFTYQYEGLEKLHETYKDSGLVILGFPANNFLKQEPGSDEEIATFCRLNYGVTFPMFSKISVKGKDIHPLYEYLTSKEADHEFGGKISWNFNKFLISKDGKIINRFGSKVKPGSEKIINAIEDAL
ncbi:MAG: glutathione peroxidase [Candidatus Tenebribacter burtonii]|nr:glutathione peroxidase [Candidatus Tenebribacter burtonii]